MNTILTKFHTSIILIIFIVAICILGIGLKEDFIVKNEEYVNFNGNKMKNFNIDKQIISDKKHLGWKAFWRENFSKWNNNIEKIFRDKPFSMCNKTKLKYDGIYDTPPFRK